jgi:DNA gyrase subunit A
LPEAAETAAAEGDGAEAAAEQAEEAAAEAPEGGEEEGDTGARYPTKGRGTQGVRDIRTTDRNGPVIAIARLTDDDEVLMMTKGGKIQRIRAADISVIGRNTQGVRIMSLDEGDTLAAVVPVPREEGEPAAEVSPETIEPTPEEPAE